MKELSLKKTIQLVLVIFALLIGLELWIGKQVPWYVSVGINVFLCLYCLGVLGLSKWNKVTEGQKTSWLMGAKMLRMLICLALLLVYVCLTKENLIYICAYAFVGYFVSLTIESVYYTLLSKPKE